jgi:hypothetical protein
MTMALTVKILITLTQLFYVGRSGASAVAIATVGTLADKSPYHTKAQRDKVDDLLGKQSLRVVGAVLWHGALSTGIWIWL